MNPLRNETGTALVAALSISMILLPIGAFVVMQARTDLAVQHNLRSEIEAFYVAEAGLEHAVAEIRPGQSLDQLLLGADHLAGTKDDGVFQFAEGPPGDFPFAPFHYDVLVTRVRTDLFQIESQGSGRNGATRTVQALVTRAHVPFTPAALYVEGSVAGLKLGGDFELSGHDHCPGASPSSAGGAAAPVPALGTALAGAESTLRNRLSEANAQQLLGSGGTPSIATPVALGLEAYAASVAGSPARVTLPASAPDGDALGTQTAPQLSFAAGDLTIAGQTAGNGVLVVRGTLRVTGSFTFAGVVIAMGGVVFESGSDVHVQGTLWRAAGLDDRLELQGRGGVAYDSGVLARVDQVFPDLLPHAAVVVGWQEEM